MDVMNGMFKLGFLYQGFFEKDAYTYLYTCRVHIWQYLI